MKNTFVLVILLIGFGCSNSKLVFKNKNKYRSGNNWLERFHYQKNEVHPMKLSDAKTPMIEVEVNHVPYWLIFDYGSSGSMTITTAIENKIDFEVIKEIKELYADGSLRGKSRYVELKEVAVFGETYKNVKCTLANWETFSSTPFDGMVSLQYVENTCHSLDYKNKKLAVSKKALPMEGLNKNNCIKIQLLKSPEWNKYGLYFIAQVNNQNIVVYVDNGSSHTFIDERLLTKEQKANIKKARYKYCDIDIPINIGEEVLVLSKIRIRPVNRNTDYKYPVRIKIGSDLLKYLGVTVDRTTGRNLLFIHK